MYAVIESGGKQYRVAIGDVIRVEKLDVPTGETVNLDRVLMISDKKEIKVGSPLLSDKVIAQVKGHGRGEKISIFKMRRRKNSRRRAGHRQDYTEIKITEIAGNKEKPPVTKTEPVKAADK
jgi:large subunit ribosomal protein L21